MKLQIESTKGLVSVGDLWDLLRQSTGGAANLDDIARGLSRQLKEHTTESFVIKPLAADETVHLKFEIVKHIIAVRLAENEATTLDRERKKKKQQLLDLIDRKRNEELESLSLEELLKQVEAL